MTTLILFGLISIAFSFLCSIWEAVLLSISPSYIKRLETENPAISKTVAEFKKDIDRPLSAILTLNTIAHTVGAILVGNKAGELYGEESLNLFGLTSISYVSLVASIMTLLILFASEIIPKTIGANNWKALTPFTVRSVNIIVFVLTPLVWLSNLLTKMLKKDKEKSIFSKNDFSAMTDVMHESGGIIQEDHTFIKNVLNFDEMKAEDVMTPKPVMFIAEETQSLEDFYKTNDKMPYSRIPIYNSKEDNITGFILRNDVLIHMIEGNSSESLSSIKKEIQFISDDTPLRTIFTLLSQQTNHLAVIVNKYGSVIGLISLEDIIETLLGFEIVDETDSVSDLQQLAKKIWNAKRNK
ncbi:MAG: CNNM domain-containing protein [Flavobacteriales bacterium]